MLVLWASPAGAEAPRAPLRVLFVGNSLADAYDAVMKRLLRFVVLAVIALLLAAVVIGFAKLETGPLEKATLAAGAALLLLGAAQVRRCPA
jgi:hypothetical protein